MNLHIGKCKDYLIKAFKKIKPNHEMLKKYTKADKKRFWLRDQNLKIRKEPFRSFHGKGNMSFFFFPLAQQSNLLTPLVRDGT